MHFKLVGCASFSKSMYLDVVGAGCEIVRRNGWVSTTWFQVTAQ